MRPLMTMVEVSALIDPRMLVEIEAVAIAAARSWWHAAVAQLVEQRTLIRRSWVRAPPAALEIAWYSALSEIGRRGELLLPSVRLISTKPWRS